MASRPRGSGERCRSWCSRPCSRALSTRRVRRSSCSRTGWRWSCASARAPGRRRTTETAFRDDLVRLDEVLATASVHAHGDFRLTAGAATPIGPTGAVRIPVGISFARYDWGTIDLEVSTAEGGSGAAAAIEYASPAPALSLFGLPDGERVALFPLPYQVAQKVH